MHIENEKVNRYTITEESMSVVASYNDLWLLVNHSFMTTVYYGESQLSVLQPRGFENEHSPK